MTDLSNACTSNQYADSKASSHTIEPLSALSHATHDSKSAEHSSSEGVVLQALPVTGLLMLRATDSRDALSKALKMRCGVALSDVLHSQANEPYCVRWMSPDSWLLSCPLQKAYELEVDLRNSVDGHLAIVNVSGGYCALQLSGEHVRELLMKSTSYDVHHDNFPAGKVINTVFAKAQVTLRAINGADGSMLYELLVRRSFADYVHLWIQQAAMEFGLRLEHGNKASG